MRIPSDIVSGVPTQFDSTYGMMELILKNETVLELLQEKEHRDTNVCSGQLDLLPDDFTVITDIVTTLEPAHEATYDTHQIEYGHETF